MAVPNYGVTTGQVYFAPAGTEPPTGSIRTDPKWTIASNENWHYTLITTGGKKLANVNVDDLFRVYPELAPTGYFGHYYDDEDRRKADQEFAKNILLAAEHNAGKKALKSLPKIKKNKEDK